jgi:hypothetical protein
MYTLDRIEINSADMHTADEHAFVMPVMESQGVTFYLVEMRGKHGEIRTEINPNFVAYEQFVRVGISELPSGAVIIGDLDEVEKQNLPILWGFTETVLSVGSKQVRFLSAPKIATDYDS